MGWTIGVVGLNSQWGLGIFIFTTTSRTALGPMQPPIQWVPGTLSLGVKQLGHEADHSLPSSAKVKNAWSYTSTAQYAFMGWCSVKPWQQLYLYLTPKVIYWIIMGGADIPNLDCRECSSGIFIY
jgi:predicted membrane channel-forming protein YqfA (hemolysin III family)